MNEFESSAEPTDSASRMTPLPFVLRDPESGRPIVEHSSLSGGPLVTRAKYAMRRKETITTYRVFTTRIKYGPGKGKCKVIKRVHKVSYVAYYHKYIPGL